MDSISSIRRLSLMIFVCSCRSVLCSPRRCLRDAIAGGSWWLLVVLEVLQVWLRQRSWSSNPEQFLCRAKGAQGACRVRAGCVGVCGGVWVCVGCVGMCTVLHARWVAKQPSGTFAPNHNAPPNKQTPQSSNSMDHLKTPQLRMNNKNTKVFANIEE